MPLGVLALVWIIALASVPVIARKRLAVWAWVVLTMVFGPLALWAVLLAPAGRARRYRPIRRARPLMKVSPLAVVPRRNIDSLRDATTCGWQAPRAPAWCVLPETLSPDLSDLAVGIDEEGHPRAVRTSR